MTNVSGRLTSRLVKRVSSQRQYPRNLKPSDSHLFENNLSIETPPSKILNFENVTALNPCWLYENHTLIENAFSSNWNPSNTKKIRMALKFALLTRFSPVIENGIWITDNWSDNYYHWFAEVIPRLYAARINGYNAPVILPAKYRNIQFVQHTLNILQSEPPIYIQPKKSLKIKQLMVATHLGLPGISNDDIMFNLATFLREGLSIGPTKGKRIYVSRSQSKMRNILNEEQLLPVLKKFDFQVVHFENLSFEKQVELAGSSSIIMGPHGAGLTNMLFMPEGSKVIEIHPASSKINACFFALCSALKHDYFYITGPKDQLDLPYQHCNFTVNPSHLEQTILKALEIS